ncbi:hypothetical protein P175DRAFT_0168239 [Aspergillus ochraceoroseus IBT 24754]|uniref:Uncharacterized protein n=1 Tax=Aspergillus ochraceoroseus IBT 24754 TaxID=1392256 RepID=A0A2T5M495_9EURO|nr:uncharacterized protein P175DRAFT_0168239 [Aspergillus ochraceoroseus IBT 24754]PTU23342.1 hypothetical protein P175DRAFT_0168239 [Aspergillus ochraceoroseus IBT 24754]
MAFAPKIRTMTGDSFFFLLFYLRHSHHPALLPIHNVLFLFISLSPVRWDLGLWSVTKWMRPC